MSCPFPGIDPFLEGQRWLDFHDELALGIRAALVPQVRPRYVVEVEERFYLEHARGDRLLVRVREVFLTLRERETRRIVTVIEVLSPTNKRHGSDGRDEYLAKREAVLLSAVHLVELDMLRGGERLPASKPLPPGDYYAFVCRADRRPMAEIYAWSLPQPLRAIPVHLATGEPDVRLDLQAVFTTAYDRGGYDYSLDYRRPADPPLSDADAAWLREVLEAASANESARASECDGPGPSES